MNFNLKCLLFAVCTCVQKDTVSSTLNAPSTLALCLQGLPLLAGTLATAVSEGIMRD